MALECRLGIVAASAPTRGHCSQAHRSVREHLSAIVSRDTARDIADRLSINVRAVKHHLTSIFNKPEGSTRVELAVFAIRHRLVAPD